MKKIAGFAASLLLATGLMATSAQAEDSSISGDIGVYSQYMWRGMQQTSNPSVQGDLGYDTGMGLSANVWFASLNSNAATGGQGNKTEFDFTLDYSGEISGFSYSLGAIAYTYQNAASGNATEVYVGAGYGPIAASFYYAVAGAWKKDAYLDLSIAQTVAGFDLGADFGFYLAGKSTTNPTIFPSTSKGLGHVDLSISKDIAAGDVSITPSFMVSLPTYKGKPRNATQFVGGVNLAF